MNSPIEDLIRDTRDPPWLYFGCYGRVGHYLIDEKGSRPNLHYAKVKFFENKDGKLCHADTTPNIVKLTRLSNVGYSAIAFWDYSIDSRGGSNSIFYAPSTTLSAETIWTEATMRFPFITKRFKPLDFSKAKD